MRLTPQGMKKIRDAVWKSCTGSDELKSRETDELLAITKCAIIPTSVKNFRVPLRNQLIDRIANHDEATFENETKIITLERMVDFV